ncbi:MAG: DUF2339 domain-containing protein, partial [Paenirhodobacter sp.]|uniref:DUF2339 domain-containing protein n=1 Tax=Paenirhodobacter sp. TaxID=1965326 RepID=UPI003D10AC28
LVFTLPALRSRVARLEAEIAALKAGTTAPELTAPKVTAPVVSAAEIAPEGPPAAPEARPAPAPAPTLSAPPPLPPEPAPPPAPRPDRIAPLLLWLRTNWTLAIAALSLILGGLFMVQYGVENGLLTPPLRVLGALALGLALIAGGEAIRRRHGDVVTPATRALPSTLSGAGAVVMFIAVASAHALYGLIGPGVALAALALVSAATVALGWIYGPVLSAIGLVGAGAAPFLLGGGSEATARLFYGYFPLVGLSGLAIDSFRRWGWVSALALGVASLGLLLLWNSAPFSPGLGLAALTLGFAALTFPERQLVPRLAGAPVTALFRGSRPETPTLIAGAGAVIATTAGLLIVAGARSSADAGLGFALLIALFAAASLWLRRAPALDPLAALPALAFLLALVIEPTRSGPLLDGLSAALTAPEGEEIPMPPTLWLLALAGATLSALAFTRLRAATPSAALLWAFGAAALGPATIFALEFFWAPGAFLGTGPWSLMVIAMAALMVLLAERRARLGGESLPRDLGLFAATATLLIALSFFILLTKAALTLALALLVVLATLIDRRFRLPLMAWVAQFGVAVIGYRLLVDPGFEWSLHRAGWPEFLLSHLGPIAAFETVRRRAPPERAGLRAVAESALITTGALFVMLAIARLIPDADLHSHWFAGLSAAIWAGAAFGQIWRLPTSGRAIRLMRALFAGLSALAACGALGALALALFDMLDWGGERVLGPPLLDSLALAFGPLAATLAAGALALGRPGRPLARLLRPGLGAGAGLALLLWGWLEIRRLWRGADLSLPGPSDGELYSYTLALLAASLVLLFASVPRRSLALRRIAMTGVALTIAKVFLIDMSGLSGLTRVASFVGLGLALTGLAWLNRQIDARWRESRPEG